MPFDPEPEVELVSALQNPYNTVIAAARTCYSSRVVTPGDVDKDDKSRELRDRIYEGIYDAGHHTTIQHPTFVFTLKKVSRQFIWSFLHAHPFYNSEQVSQRYVEVKRQNFVTPPLEGPALELYTDACERMMKAYFKLIDLLGPDIEAEYFKLYPARRKSKEKWENAIHKRVLEAARYVLPVATHAHLYHTVSGITLHRYKKLCDQFDTPLETRVVVDKMIAAVNAFDPLFFRKVDDPVRLSETLEHRMFEETRRAQGDSGGAAFAREFDADLGPLRSKLVDWKANAEKVMAQSVRSMLGLQGAAMSDADAIDLVMNPSKNRILGESLVLTTMSKLSRAMNHPHYTFRKKISHTADSQDQRHRMVPGSRPVLAAQFVPDHPDLVLPPVMERNAEVADTVAKLMRRVWKAIGDLRGMGVPWEFAQYLLPNAFPIRFEESGDLMHLHHKWTTRLCYLAQEEIWRCCVEEVRQVATVHPALATHLTAPCGLRKTAGASPFCPEGNRFCGVRVWDLPLDQYARVI
ncbi:MAG TPA: FAD-dependent thymidylate synthase [Planctomycetota bacterium]|nr:FAD-dependent thymidylate synthase [Planctomycetota bacterium]